MEALRHPLRSRTRTQSYELLSDDQIYSPRTPFTEETQYRSGEYFNARDVEDESRRDSRHSSRYSLVDSLKQRVGLHPATRTWVRTIIIHFLVFLWLVPIGVLLWFNFSSRRIGAALWCPKQPCNFNPFSLESFHNARQLDRSSRNLLGALQLVAKALEVWFVAIASGFIFTVASFLVVRSAGLPLSMYTAYVEFSDVRILGSREYWTSLLSLRRSNGEKNVKRDWLLLFFVALVGLSCVLANLMGPAVAVLLMPRLQQIPTPTVHEKLFANMSSDTKPHGDAAIPFCTQDLFLQYENYNCTWTAYGPALDAWVASGEAFQGQRPYVATLWPNGTAKSSDELGTDQNLYAVSQEWAVSFAFNASTNEGVFWTPSRQALRNVSADLESYYAMANNNASLSDLQVLKPSKEDPMLLWREANATDMFRAVPDKTFEELTSSLNTVLQRQGPAIGAAINFYQYSRFHWIDVEPQNKSIFCVQGWSPASAADPAWNGTKCHVTGSKWAGGRNLDDPFDQWLTIMTDTVNGTSLSFGLHYAPKAIYFNSTFPADPALRQDFQRCFQFQVNRTGPYANCNYQSYFYDDGSRYPDNAHDYILSNVHSIFFGMDKTGTQIQSSFHPIAIEFDPRVALVEYELDTSPFTNTLRIVELNRIPEAFNETFPTPIQVHPAWMNAVFSSYRDNSSDFVTEASMASASMLDVLQDISSYSTLSNLFTQANNQTDTDEMADARSQYYRLFYVAHLLTLHMLSMLPFAIQDIGSGPSNLPVLWRNAVIEVWTYGLDSRTSQMGVAVVIAGSVVTIAYIVLGFWTQVKIRSPTTLLASALVHFPEKDELAEAKDDEGLVGRIRYGSNFRNQFGWLKYDKIL